MKRWDARQLLLTLVTSVLIWAIVAGACLLVGSTGNFGWPTRELIRVRGELVLLASLVGAALACAGVVYQAIFRNPLADPYLLGVSSGASLAAYAWRFPLLSAAISSLIGSSASQQMFAFAGAVIAVAVVFAVASAAGGRAGRFDPLTLLLVGVIVNAINGSIYLLFNSIVRDLPGAGGPLTFLVGGLQTDLQPAQFRAAAICVGIGWIILFFVAGQLNVTTMGDAEASSLGANVNRVRWMSLVIASLVTAAAVAVSGPIGFVGLVCPHLARIFVGNDQRKLLPVATAIGAALLAAADAISRKLGSQNSLQTILPVGVLTGLLGGPFFLLLLTRGRRRVADA